MSFEFQKNVEDTLQEHPQISKKLSVCTCVVEYSSKIPSDLYHMVVLGCFTSLPFEEYPHIEIFGIAPEYIEI